MHNSEYSRIEQLEEIHFWYRAMESNIIDLLERFQMSNISILDAGCGTGGLSQKMMRFGNVVAMDINPVALKYAKRKKINKVLKGSVEAIPFANNQFDILVSLDVLYHRKVNNDKLALKEFLRVLKPGGLLVLRVPAFELLRGAHDRMVETRHRYTIGEMRKKLLETGFVINKISYANMLLCIPLFIKRYFERINNSRISISDTYLLNDTINKLLFFYLNLENKLLFSLNLPFGSSVIAIAKKQN